MHVCVARAPVGNALQATSVNPILTMITIFNLFSQVFRQSRVDFSRLAVVPCADSYHEQEIEDQEDL